MVAGESYGKVRAIIDDKGNKIYRGELSQPVDIIGFNSVQDAWNNVI